MTEVTFPKSIWVYVDTSKQVGDANQLFASEAAAEPWFRESQILKVLPSRKEFSPVAKSLCEAQFELC